MSQSQHCNLASTQKRSASNMYLLLIFTLLGAILSTTSALPNTIRDFPDLPLLPSCARSCSAISKAATDCLQPNRGVAAIDYATYVGCLCKNEWLHSLSLNNIGGICGHRCDTKNEVDLVRYYGELCGVPSLYVTFSSTVPAIRTPIHNPPAATSSTASTLILAPSQSSLHVLGEPQENRETTESW